MKAELHRKTEEGKVQCLVCPHYCILGDGKKGICGVREGRQDSVDLLTYGIISGLALDPVEKKPLYHYFPGSSILSAGSFGCNMRCDFCQNYHISQNADPRSGRSMTAEDLARRVTDSHDNIGIAFTFNEPAVWLEFIRDTAIIVRKLGYKNVMVTNGFISPGALSVYLDLIDAFNVDLKAFSLGFYRKYAGAGLEPVLQSLKSISKSDSHLEITSLIIPGLNDSEADMEQQVKWIADQLGRDVPFHLSRYFPNYKRTTEPTPTDTLESLRLIAAEHLNFVYTGNTRSDEGQNTYCPGCKSVITERLGYDTRHTGTTDGRCRSCGKEIYRYFTSSSFSKKRS